MQKSLTNGAHIRITVPFRLFSPCAVKNRSLSQGVGTTDHICACGEFSSPFQLESLIWSLSTLSVYWSFKLVFKIPDLNFLFFISLIISFFSYLIFLKSLNLSKKCLIETFEKAYLLLKKINQQNQ